MHVLDGLTLPAADVGVSQLPELYTVYKIIYVLGWVLPATDCAVPVLRWRCSEVTGFMPLV